MTEFAVAFGVPLTNGLGRAGYGGIVREGTSFPGGTTALPMKFARYMTEIYSTRESARTLLSADDRANLSHLLAIERSE